MRTSVECQTNEVTRILNTLCIVMRVNRSGLLGHDRHKSVAQARIVAYWLVRTRLELSYPEVARIFRRDHTTIMAGITRVNRRLEALDDAWVEPIQAINAILDERRHVHAVRPAWLHLATGASGEQCCYDAARDRCA